MAAIQHINRNSDFSLLVQFTINGIPSPIPTYPWKFVFTTDTTHSFNRYVAYFDGETFHNCSPISDTEVLVVFERHNLGAGLLQMTLEVDMPSELYPDGVLNAEIPSFTQIELWDKASDPIVPAPQIEAAIAYVIHGKGVPPDGKAGQVLKKKSDTDFDTAWGDDEGITEIAPGAVKRENLSQEVIDEIDSKPGQVVPAAGSNTQAEVFNAALYKSPADSAIKPGVNSHAENIGTFAGGEGAHAENIGTLAMAYGSHAEGCNTEVQAAAKFGHVGGNGSTVEAEAGFAHGVNAVSRNRAEAVFGKNNDPDSTGKSVFQVGIGENKKHPKTGFQLDSDGTIWVINTNTGSRISLQSWLNDIQLKKIVVDQLPEAGAPSTVYLLRVTAPDESRHNFFEEYIYIDGAWEMLGTSDTDESIIERILSNPAFKVDSQQIVDKAIQTKHLSDGCVTTDAIQDGAIGNEKIASKTITQEKIADGSITYDLLAKDTKYVLDNIRVDLNSEIQERINGDQSIREHLYSIENGLNRTVKTTKQNLTETQQEQAFENLGIKTVYLDYATDVGNVLPEELIAKIADASRIVLDDPNIGRLVLQLGFVDSRSRYFITVRSNGTLYRGVMNSETRVFHAEILSFVDQTSVKFNVSQNLTDNNKKIARTNIGAQEELSVESKPNGDISIQGLGDTPVNLVPADRLAPYVLKLKASANAPGGYTLEGTTEELEATARSIASNPHARVYLDCSIVTGSPTPIPMSIIMSDAEGGVVYLEADPYIYDSMIQSAGGSELDISVIVTIGPELLQAVVRKSVSEEIKKRLFIDIWNDVCGTYGTYNNQTGYFELNGLTDITYEEALDIYRDGTFDSLSSAGKNFSHRTNLPIRARHSTGTIAMSFTSDDFAMDTEVANLKTLNSSIGFSAYPISIYNKPMGYAKLKKIIGFIDFHFARATINWFVGATNIEEVEIHRLAYSINLGSCSKLSLQSFTTLINNADSDKDSGIHPRVVTVHADVYAKLTGDTTSSAAAALTEEELAQWAQVLTDAMAKNISFATV